MVRVHQLQHVGEQVLVLELHPRTHQAVAHGGVGSLRSQPTFTILDRAERDVLALVVEERYADDQDVVARAALLSLALDGRELADQAGVGAGHPLAAVDQYVLVYLEGDPLHGRNQADLLHDLGGLGHIAQLQRLQPESGFGAREVATQERQARGRHLDERQDCRVHQQLVLVDVGIDDLPRLQCRQHRDVREASRNGDEAVDGTDPPEPEHEGVVQHPQRHAVYHLCGLRLGRVHRREVQLEPASGGVLERIARESRD
mmetsp:Transcript_17909/g.56430  ORF Transcript_17909/g.56430 Transcript_17909/m.56430 type:complete len:259 (-) Transcript_17909:223-999(-)